jgi:hypothetical protein
MKKIESKETKAVSKNLPGRKRKKKKPGRGGARPGAGRKPNPFETHQAYVDIRIELIEGIDKAGITNRSGYINDLIEADLKIKKVL